MSFKGEKYYVYVRNLSPAYFENRPDITRAQLPIKEEFSKIKESNIPFIFMGYDRFNDVLVCWNFYMVKKRLNERKSVSFYSRRFFQEEVSPGEFLRKRLKNNDEPVIFKRKDLVMFFENIHTFFNETYKDQSRVRVQTAINGKITEIVDVELLNKLKPLLDIETPHTLEAIKIVQGYYGDIPDMRFRDWANLIKKVKFNHNNFEEGDCELVKSST